MIIFALLSIPISDLKLPIFILIIATTILLFADANPLYGLFVGVREMRNIIGLLVVIPLIKWVLQEENYVEDMMSVFNKFINTSKDRKSTPSELQSRGHLVCRLLLEKKKNN